ncbi:hypothetical protein TNCV_2096501 [Trichonephila clavipes]|nr:hypothetical protein TNCV_2096501 [Trichonephila clavipes]
MTRTIEEVAENRRCRDTTVAVDGTCVWTLVPVRLDKQYSDHTTVDEIASEAADYRLTYTMANFPQRREEKKDKGRSFGKRSKKDPGVLDRDADQES